MTDSSHSDVRFDDARPASETPGWNLACDYGFEPTQDIADNDAVWIAPDLLIALNAWRKRHDLAPLLFEAPPADWLSSLPIGLTGRKAVSATVSHIRSWTAFPEGLGERPWSQLGNGRVPEFRAARRTLAELQGDLRDAPDDSLISVNAHIPAIAEEWCVIIRDGVAAASCGYCVHPSLNPESHDILTVFDGARFHETYRAIAEAKASAAAQSSHLGNASIIVGFQDTEAWRTPDKRNTPTITERVSDLSLFRTSSPSPAAFILEVDPVWCTTPYPFRTVEENRSFLETIADSRVRQRDDGLFETSHGPTRTVPADNVYEPDPWMIRHHIHRYDGVEKPAL
ncbi:hypothetical protein OZX73_06400 [Bifidobacterium sp. ESL0775]|uniref:hypothetical protein n=1 Tax=Bifidobacterium sp. ESL0775 TaxID=2983230 RepID=UPI0023F960EA|nr:hypothetical protein [Bifidobacterium sp. ESL0775]WEV68908.1 hypothetical protein OZX73_06400 [Bifidobacterium sp. ESL0775]